MFSEYLGKLLDRFKVIITTFDLAWKGWHVPFSVCYTPEEKHSLWIAAEVYADDIHVSTETKSAPSQLHEEFVGYAQ
jgi:hypothetical protein